MGRTGWFRALAIVTGMVLVLGVVEIGLRLARPYKTHRAAREIRHFRAGGEELAGGYVVDPDFGFRPRLGTDRYSKWGTLHNTYELAKPPGVERLLFAGDSATHRGELIRALRERYGDEGYEYWNAGVESFNTLQELELYRRFNAPLEPDQVVLTFHLNDFSATPVAFREDSGALVVYTPHRPRWQINELLFRHLHLYRLYVGAATRRSRAEQEVAAEVENALIEFRDLVEPDGRFTVIVLPVLQPPADWKPKERRAHESILRILRTRSISHFDLLPVLEAELERGGVLGDPEGDPWHPSRPFARAAAAYLRAENLLGD